MASPVSNTRATIGFPPIWLQESVNQSAFCGAGCHFGDLPDFDHYLDIRRIPLDRAGESFADYLTLAHGWDGQFRRVDLHVIP
jgi:hypothetical protein